MKERPILMTPENAQKCHDGTKTMTRRIVKLHNWFIEEYDQIGAVDIRANHECPYGVVGDQLWIREAWRLVELQERPPQVDYKGSAIERLVKPKWKPAIHMPRWACRTILEITEIRVQRLQEISEEDAKAEGVKCGVNCPDHIIAFGRLWESINGPGSWAANPWVWCVSFKKVSS